MKTVLPVFPGTYFAVVACDTQKTISYPQDRMGEKTNYLIFEDETVAEEEMKNAEKWQTRKLKVVKMEVKFS